MIPEELIKEKFGSQAKIEKMAGDASDRTFYRIRKENASYVLMKYSSPFKEEELSYINIWRFLNHLSFPVPQILDIQPQHGILVLSDLGDTLLQDSVLHLKKEKIEEGILALYRAGVEIIVDLQIKGTPALDENCFASKSSLDRERFLFELNFFHEHYVRGLLQMDLDYSERGEITKWFEKLSKETSHFEHVLCHRDFHSRNLLVFGGKLYMTDFQDAQLGPYTYDLASFLRDSYIAHKEEFVDEMVDYYFTHARKKAIQHDDRNVKEKNSRLAALFLADDQRNKERLRREFDLTCIQRNIKAIGTFAFQSHVKKNHHYLQYIPLTLNHVKANLKKWSINIPTLNAILDQSLPKT